MDKKSPRWLIICVQERIYELQERYQGEDDQLVQDLEEMVDVLDELKAQFPRPAANVQG